MKGQAAVEYLTTYGWAILALLIVVVVLLTSGIFSPTYLIAEQCSFGNNLPCTFALYNEGQITQGIFNIFNGYPYKIKIIEMSIETEDGTQTFSGLPSGLEIASGDNETFEGKLSGDAIPPGNIKRFRGNITYISCASELGPQCSENEHVVTGRIVGRVIPE